MRGEIIKKSPKEFKVLPTIDEGLHINSSTMVDEDPFSDSTDTMEDIVYIGKVLVDFKSRYNRAVELLEDVVKNWHSLLEVKPDAMNGFLFFYRLGAAATAMRRGTDRLEKLQRTFLESPFGSSNPWVSRAEAVKKLELLEGFF